ncbi:MAG: diaminopimelate decarboxylase [Ponticaulis sp.]|nr:diaminopimelate decarboxylase [Ponticaulis sp.]
MSDTDLLSPSLEGETPHQEISKTWWNRPDLSYDESGRLKLGACDLDALARRFGTPTYVIRAPRVVEKLKQIHAALDAAGVTHRIYYAIKANRTVQLLTYLAGQGLCGADVCSPEEMRHAISCGFPEDQISFTGTSLSATDIEQISRFSDLSFNPDSLNALKKIGKLKPGSEVGIRINPDIGIGYAGNDMLQYSGNAPTKFGIYLDRIAEAKEIAKTYGLKIVRIHFHAGCGYLDRELSQLSRVLDVSRKFLDQLPDVREVNIGGGLGVPHNANDKSLDLDKWASVIANAFEGRNLTIAIEPGDFLVKDSGILLTSVTYQETRKSVEYLGLDAGFNLAMEPAFYSLPCEPVCAVMKPGDWTNYTLVGNVNEALDKWAENHPMSPVDEGDIVALLNAGGYASSMRSSHCMRGDVREVLLLE